MDVIRRVRKLINIRKVGHAGTLDPLATGVLLVCVGKATKKIDSLMATQKEYLATINLEAFSATDDAQGPISPVAIEKAPTQAEIEAVLALFVGTIAQKPPAFSAIKLGGEAAYKKARRGEVVEIKERFITIDAIELLDYTWPELKIRVVCQKGTYIRSLARDIGSRLGTGGYLTSLTRTRVGNFDLAHAINLATCTTITQQDFLSL